MKPDGNLNIPWELCGYSDRDYTGDINTQRIVTVYILLINIFFIAWHSPSQKIVTLSVTEYEHSEIMIVCCKILFFHATLPFMGVVFE